MKISSISATRGSGVVTNRPEQSIREAIALLVEPGNGSLVVVDEAKKPIGIITEGHIARRAAESEHLLAEAVHHLIMNRRPGRKRAARPSTDQAASSGALQFTRAAAQLTEGRR